MHKFTLTLLSIVTLFIVTGADSNPARESKLETMTSQPSAAVMTPEAPRVRTEAPPSAPGLSAQSTPLEFESPVVAAPARATAAYQINWSSINGGGATSAASANYKMGLSVGQSVAGSGASASYQAGIGFWYGVGGGGGGACAIAQTGDINLTGTLTSADIIYLVNFVFKGGATPMPCEAAADVNCTGTITSADIIYLVNHVFKGGAAPCDVCTLIPSQWSCP